MSKKVTEILIAFAVVLLVAVGFMLLGIFINIQIITKYDYTPISFTFTLLFVGTVIGFLLAFKTTRHLNGLYHSKEN